MSDLIIWLALFVMFTIFCVYFKNAKECIYYGICLMSIFECVVGIGQLMGFHWFPNNHFNLTGTFNNPGPYGCFVAIALSLAISRLVLKKTDLLSIVTVLSGLFILPATLSRTGWLALFLSLLMLALLTPSVRSFILGRRATLFISLLCTLFIAIVR